MKCARAYVSDSRSVESDSVTARTIHLMEFSRPTHRCGQPFPSLGDLPNPGIKPRSPALQADSLSAEPQGKPKKTGVGSLSLLQGIFLTQVSNWGLLHCRWILYQLNYQGSLMMALTAMNILLHFYHSILFLFSVLLFLTPSVRDFNFIKSANHQTMRTHTQTFGKDAINQKLCA